MHREVRVNTGSRLHCGLLSHDRHAGRRFGGAGLMIEAPGLTVEARSHDADEVVGSTDEKVPRRTRRFLETYRERCPADRQPPPCHLQVTSGIPEHRGFGSGTQLGMAVARALSLLAGEEHVPAEELARRAGRGRRSAVGIHGFARGGFLVDGGKRTREEVGTLVARAAFPADWRLLLVTPHEGTGLWGQTESDAFARLPPMPHETTGRLCQLLLLHLLPALTEADFDATGDALYEFGRTVGEYFAPVQGGTYANPRMRELVAHLRKQGVRGVGQTSWGPTLFVLCPDTDSAERLQGDLAAEDRWSDCYLPIAVPMNSGANVQAD